MGYASMKGALQILTTSIESASLNAWIDSFDFVVEIVHGRKVLTGVTRSIAAIAVTRRRVLMMPNVVKSVRGTIITVLSIRRAPAISTSEGRDVGVVRARHRAGSVILGRVVAVSGRCGRVIAGARDGVVSARDGGERHCDGALDGR